MKKRIPEFKVSVLVGLLLLGITGYSQTTCDFSTPATLSYGENGSNVWYTQANVIIGGVDYQLVCSGNGSFSNVASGGASGSKCLRKDGAGGDFFKLQRADGKPFQFYGLWVNHQSMNQYSTMMQVPPWYKLTASTFTFEDNTTMTPGTNWNNYTSSTQTISAGTGGITTGSVEIVFSAILYFSIDNIIVGPAPLAASQSQTNVSCNGGSNGIARVTASGGTTPYSYAWSPSGGTAATASGLTSGNYTCTIKDGVNGTVAKSFTITQPAAITVVKSQTNISCNGGSNGIATISVSGGTSPYSYSWSPSGGSGASITGLTAQTYTCTITDAKGCTALTSISITQPTVLAAGTSKTDVSCNGGSNGSATVSVTGGTAPYSYSWSPSGGTGATASGLSAYMYTCTITDNNSCQLIKTVTVTQPAVLSMTPASQTNIACNGGSNGAVTVNTPTGGTGTYTYDWTPGTPTGDGTKSVSGLIAGTWICTATDANGCTTSKSFTITQPTALTMTTASQTNVSCNGGSNGAATVNTPTGGTGTYTYNWSPGTPTGDGTKSVSGLIAGTWICTTTDANGCATSKSFTITQPTALSAGTSKTDVTCNGSSNGSATVSVSGGTAPYSYSWSPSGGTEATASGLSAYTYTCTITDYNSCELIKTVTVTQPGVLMASTSKTNASYHGASDGTATVTASGGTTPYSYSWSPGGGTTATAAGLTAGDYILTVKDANMCVTTKTVTITDPAATTAMTTAISNLTGQGVTLNGTVNSQGVTTHVTFEYGTSITYGTSVSAIQSPVLTTEPTSVSYLLTGLTMSTTYHYRVLAVNAGGTAYGDDAIFKTTSYTDVKSLSDKKVLKVYPNPVSDRLYIETEGNQLPVVKLYNLQGILLLVTKDKSVDMTVYSPGVYVMEVYGTRLIVLKK